MNARSIVSAVVLLVAGSVGHAQEILRGTLKQIEVEQRRVVVTIDGKDREFALTDGTEVLDARGKDLAEKLRDFKAGAAIFVRPVSRGGKEVLLGIKLAGERPARNPGENADASGPRRGTFKQFNAERKTITLTADGKDVELAVTERSDVRGGEGEAAIDRIKSLKAGADVMFLPGRADGKEVLLGLRFGTGDRPAGQRILKDTSSLRPLTELGTAEYQGFAGGLYPKGANARPAEHEAAGAKLAAAVQPLDANGQPDPSGRIVLLSIGMSNTSQISDGFREALRGQDDLHPRFVFVNGAQGGMTAAAIQDAEDGQRGTRYWTTVDERLKQAGVTRQQVQAVWIKQADAGPSQGFPKYAQTLQEEFGRIVRLVSVRFPNAKLAYLSSRTYGGFATTSLNPEPYAYESGFSVKWLIEQQLSGEANLNFDPARGAVKAPWLSWGPYLWANGEMKRNDGFSYEPADFAGDGTHHATSGQRKTGRLLLEFFRSDATTKGWFLRK